jgi:hypothetical protein
MHRERAFGTAALYEKWYRQPLQNGFLTMLDFASNASYFTG